MEIPKQLPLIVYTPESKIKNPLHLISTMWHGLVNSQELAWRLFIRDISAQYRQSIFGVFWGLLPPLVTGLLFIALESRQIINFPETVIPYPLYVLIGTTLWQLFVDSLNAPLKSISQSRPIIAKINIPYEALIVSAFYGVVFSLLLKSVILAALFIYYKIPMHWTIIFLPFALLMLILLGMCIGLLITPFGMLYTDVSSSLPIITQLWFFLTPVVYPPLTTYPLVILTILNPVTPLLVGARNLMIVGDIGAPTLYFTVCFLTIVILFIAWIIYRLSIQIIIERISS